MAFVDTRPINSCGVLGIHILLPNLNITGTSLGKRPAWTRATHSVSECKDLPVVVVSFRTPFHNSETVISSLNKRYADAEDDDDAATQSKRLGKRKLGMPVWAVILVLLC